MSKPRVPQELIDLIVQEGQSVEFAEGEVIFHAGRAEQSMFLIRAGRVLIRFEGGWGEVELNEGEIFGELALIFENHCRTATAIALTAVQASRIQKPGFERLADKSPRLMFDLLRATSATLLQGEIRLVERLKAANRSLEQANDYLVRTRTELSERELEARTDSLTGVYNRRCFDENVEDHLPRKPGDAPLGVLLVDLDHFKTVNDNHGHACGDEVLKAVATIIRKNIRKTDLPCRIGGDEFAILLIDTTEVEARAIGQRIQDDISRHVLPIPYQSVAISISMGGSLAADDESVDALMRRVDGALYGAKASGRGRVVWEHGIDETVVPV